MRVVSEKPGVVDIRVQYREAKREYKVLLRRAFTVEHRAKTNEITAFEQRLDAAADRVASLYAMMHEGLV